MANKVYYDKNGRPDSLPAGQDNGKQYRTLRYTDRENKCQECGGHVFYTKNAHCWKCAQSRACDLYSYVNGLMEFDQGVDGWFTSYGAVNNFQPVGNRLVAPEYRQELEDTAAIFDISAPSSIQEAVKKDLDLWVTGDPCTKAGHYGIRTLENKCYFCEEERNKPKPRQTAIAAGKTWYTPDTPCKKCNTLSERNVHTGVCKGCRPNTATEDDDRTTPDSIMMKAQPDMVITRDAAKALGMKVYRHGRPCNKGHKGFRYISTNNCIDCLRHVAPVEEGAP